MQNNNDIETYLLMINEKAEKVFNPNENEAVSVCLYTKDRKNQKPFVQGWIALFNLNSCLNDNLSKDIFEGDNVIKVLEDINFYLECALDKMASQPYSSPNELSYEEDGFGD